MIKIPLLFKINIPKDSRKEIQEEPGPSISQVRELPSVPSPSTLTPPSSETLSSIPFPPSFETPTTANLVATPDTSLRDTGISDPNLEKGKGKGMDDASAVKETKEYDDDDVFLSTKWEHFKTMRTTSARKHIAVKPSLPRDQELGEHCDDRWREENIAFKGK
ncbi:hypothetical protein HAX54_047026 [Datura stramonium]|uniref:Uncharacterized protein n=1 Tax=Datura stramonium TaxID=4076 RepID=A0ABS8SS94_DATST|nr:hypothetical protein [Datura stramonium]